ncbi:CPBP family intramembrane glutamic endopeptidase [Persicitalea jodogahamensis]|uniref:CAAX prenyl protease 2/Lysostaphin resistance protein A-like domain-containing protein n=1 Tax=Persicitalea jodogahamensis TaxID=402147 RepID=A0A8J3D506_9BACT|nr:CPBP family intramembrane glutamic endopeptidase [Persicitalea jodogahamensis]GHB76235.1 hypothetical protein GCM10007390_32650 [Persicitalea jodogahamensis]
MEHNPHLSLSSRVPNTWRSLLVLVGFILVGMSVGNMLAVLFLMKFLGSGEGMAGIEIVSTLIQSPESVPNGWYGLMLLQATAHVSTYLIPPILYWSYIERRSLPDFRTRALTPPQFWGLTLLVVLAFMPLNGLIIEWNQGMVLPDFLSGVEQWMRDKEEQLEGLTNFLTDFDSPTQFAIALLVIGIIPAIGEEVLFRGVLQRKLMEEWLNPHLAIWVAAALFSAIHVQFYGFIPRMLLGALFGYLYYWSGSLWVAIFAHFVNNGFMVMMLYLYHQKMVDYNIEDNESVPWSAALISLVATSALLYAAWKQKRTV